MSSLVIGLVYDLLGSHPRRPGDPPDVDAEYEPEATVRALEAAIERLGHRAVRLGNPHALLAAIGKGELPSLDAALSIAEGYGGRNREAWAPVLLELAGVPQLGSDALTLSLTLDKALARTLVEAAQVPVAAGWVIGSQAELDHIDFTPHWPLFVKPRWEGTAKGIGPTSRVEDRAALTREVLRIARDYQQPALVEAFVPGAEFTVMLAGTPPRALPVLQRAIDALTGIGVHALERHAAPPGGWRPITPGVLDAALEASLAELSLRAFDALGCRDFARADFRLDASGQARFLEMNPLPTFAADGSFGILAELEGRSHEALLADVIGASLARLGLAAAR